MNIELSASFGFATKENDTQITSDILAKAENHMYQNKIYEHLGVRSDTVDIIMNTLFAKSNRESLHSKRVSKICQAIATKMKLSEDYINRIKIAGLLHDIGKIGVIEQILNKNTALSNNEKKEIQKHPEIGWRILYATNEFSELAEFILEHHERWDGKGYPKGLKGEEISLEARIISVADAFDAMTSVRSYKNKKTKEEAIEELKKCSGTQFDPKIVNIFINHVLKTNRNVSKLKLK